MIEFVTGLVGNRKKEKNKIMKELTKSEQSPSPQNKAYNVIKLFKF